MRRFVVVFAAVVTLLASGLPAASRQLVAGLQANLAGCEASAEGTLATATALNPYIGYDKAGEIVKEATKSGRPLREVAREQGVDEETLTKALNLREIAAGSGFAE